MKVVVVGSVALDSVKTPFGKAENVLGGSATYAAYCSSFFAKTGIVGVAGQDFPKRHIELLKKKGIDIEGLSVVDGKTFYWEGFYEFDLNQAHTIKTELNVFQNFEPVLPENYRAADFLFLGNISPKLQLNVLSQMKKRPKLVVSDTMNYYIEREKENVLKVVKEVDIALMNDSEARELFKTPNLVQAARKILALNSDYAIIKKGENGSIMFTKNSHFAAPGYPLENVVDPTGCGDCFAGALIGYLAKKGKVSEKEIRRSMVYASAMASINAEGFSLNALKNASMKTINARAKEFKGFLKF